MVFNLIHLGDAEIAERRNIFVPNYRNKVKALNASHGGEYNAVISRRHSLTYADRFDSPRRRRKENIEYRI
jgi:hypothetical protein